MNVGILGNGNVGSRIAALLRDSGHSVLASGHAPGPGEPSFADAASHGSVVILAIPYIAVHGTLPSVASALDGKVVIDATNPLHADWSPLELPDGRSAGETIQELLPNSKVVKAFNTIFADVMRTRAHAGGVPRTTAFYCGDDPSARKTVGELLADIDFDPCDAGPLRAARYLEAMAHLNIQLAVGMEGGTNALFHYHRVATSEFVS